MQWLQENRLGVAIGLGTAWMALMFLLLRNAAIAVVCGAAFAGVLALFLPRPPGKSP
jgi:hypothetical protein